MLADDELRGLLVSRLPDLRPEVETELERVLSRTTTRARRRRAAYIGGLAAAVVATVLVLGHDWRPRADSPDPVDHVDQVEAHDLVNRGMYAAPAALNVGRYRARMLSATGGLLDLQFEVDVPSGWGQDDVYAFATGPAGEDATMRLDMFADVRQVRPDPCTQRRVRPGPTTRDLAVALAGLAKVTHTGPVPATVDGYPGHFVRLHGRGAPGVSAPCTGGTVPVAAEATGAVQACELPGWTSLIWVVEVGGHRITLAATHGPGVSPAEEPELVGIVESLTFVLP
jgi:hypothetical protein